MNTIDKLRELSGLSVDDWNAIATTKKFVSGAPVQDTDEVRRVLALPRRPPANLEDPDIAQAYVKLMTERLRRTNPSCKCASMGRSCITELLPAQAWALYEAPLAGGLVGLIGVGHGKTGLDILMSMVLPGCKTAVLLVPSNLKVQLVNDYFAWAEHFTVPSLVTDDVTHIIPGRPVLHVIPFAKFSRPESTTLLESIDPTDVIIDEGHNVRRLETARTARLLRFFINAASKRRRVRLCVWSGTLIADSICDVAHLLALSLREGSPLPIDPAIVEEWALAIDPSESRAPEGALRALMRPREDIVDAVHRRMIETRGVIATRSGSINATINIIERKPPPIPDKLQNMLRDMRKSWARPDGEELFDVLEVKKNLRAMGSGLYFRFRFPKGEPEDLIVEWFDRRKPWHKELRDKLTERKEHLDSEKLCRAAAIRAYQTPAYEGPLPVWPAHSWPAWAEIKDLVEPESEAVWIDDWLARDAAEWAREHRGIVWYEHDAFGRRVAELAGLPLHEGGPDAEQKILAERGDRSIVASIKSHGEGRDGLQRLFRSQLVAQPPSSGKTWEQLLGRLHRPGQKADEVDTYVYRHTTEVKDALDAALRKAKFIEGLSGAHQKLRSATCSFSLAY